MKLVLVALALAAPFGLAMGPSKAGTCVFADQECAWESPTSDVCADSCNNVGNCGTCTRIGLCNDCCCHNGNPDGCGSSQDTFPSSPQSCMVDDDCEDGLICSMDFPVIAVRRRVTEEAKPKVPYGLKQ